MRKIHHAIDNVEFGVSDMTSTRAFYESAFGWRFNDYGPRRAVLHQERIELGPVLGEEVAKDARLTRGRDFGHAFRVTPELCG
jgi:predicted enzyme related to lactoylglutathione lyase